MSICGLFSYLHVCVGWPFLELLFFGVDFVCLNGEKYLSIKTTLIACYLLLLVCS
ncbi:hypothetical protein Syun_018941 [Stephania yunnanensis]|uniref:Uncharacterized protein n=1 Tax=Stephania yunnanensis TaxID=152371 RepID=A0AAP0ITB8_9MAGN